MEILTRAEPAPLRPTDLPALARLGQALWAGSGRSLSLTVETISAIALREDADFERAARALLTRAERELVVGGDRLEAVPFFRLSAPERFLLVALHSSPLGRWSYARAQRVFGSGEGDGGRRALETHLWNARMRLAELSVGTGAMKNYPVGGGGRSSHCPDYDPRRPWAQRFLDDEITGTERAFLQNHLMACDGCRRALHAAKDIYYTVDREIARAEQPTARCSLRTDEAVVPALEQVLRESRILRNPSTVGFLPSLIRFVRRDDMRFAAVAFVLFVLWAVFHR